MGVISLEELGLSNEDLTAIGKLAATGLTPQQIADNIKYGAKDFINTDTAGLEISVSEARSVWTRGLTSFSGMIAIEILNIYNISDLNSIFNIELLPSNTEEISKNIHISCKWNSDTNNWTYGFADDLLDTEEINIRFAKNINTNKMYILLGELTTLWPDSRIKINIPLSSLTENAIDFNIYKLTSLTGIVIDITKAISTKVNHEFLGTLADFNSGLN